MKEQLRLILTEMRRRKHKNLSSHFRRAHRIAVLALRDDHFLV